MDFFQAQQNARTSTFRLLIMFGMAIICLILITDIFFFIALGLAESELSNNESFVMPQFNATVFLIVSGVVLLTIVIGSTYKSIVLSSGGGRAIAESMGARLILSSTTELQEKRLLNVVEEMAIASGMPVPQVYILDEEAVINAFAAGLTTGDAVIGVTKGTVDTLNRDELQGVIAHEYSHILNGDMALNIQLIGILHGILILGIIGELIVRSTGRSRSKDSGGFVLFGIGLIVIGYGGTFFGNLIKSSISRQREFLADASAVQFTRNPEGIAGALKKIGGMSDKSLLKNENAPEMSHAFFSQGVSNYFGSLSATHPPLKDRIGRIDPRWDGKFLTTKIAPNKNTETPAEKADSRREEVAKIVTSTIVLQSVLNSMEHMGNPGEKEIETARSIIAQLPAEIHNAIHDPYGARAVIYCLVINREESVRKVQLEHIQTNGDYGIYDLCLKYLPLVDDIPRRCRLAVIDMSVPSLRELSLSQYKKFRTNLGTLVAADNSLDLFEWCIQKILYKHLDEAFFVAKPPSAKYASYDLIKDDCRMVFSVLAYAGHKKQEEADAAFSEAVKVISLSDLSILDKSDISLTKFDKGLDNLLLLKPLLKRDFLKACLASAMTDNKMTAREMELIRAIADTLNCPIPPIDSDE
ncbi:MAG: Zn-dependent protease with chaperone function [Gammaproteobacteria bacterium]